MCICPAPFLTRDILTQRIFGLCKIRRDHFRTCSPKDLQESYREKSGNIREKKRDEMRWDTCMATGYVGKARCWYLNGFINWLFATHQPTDSHSAPQVLPENSRTTENPPNYELIALTEICALITAGINYTSLYSWLKGYFERHSLTASAENACLCLAMRLDGWFGNSDICKHWHCSHHIVLLTM